MSALVHFVFSVINMTSSPEWADIALIKHRSFVSLAFFFGLFLFATSSDKKILHFGFATAASGCILAIKSSLPFPCRCQAAVIPSLLGLVLSLLVLAVVGGGVHGIDNY